MAISLRAISSLALVVPIVSAAVVAQVWTPYDPQMLDLRMRLVPPGGAHLLGTDEFGRDVLSRLMAGAAASMSIALMTVIIALILGGAIGLVAGYFRGWIDRLIMTLNDTLLAFPGILLALALLVVIGSGPTGIVVALGIAYAPSVARVVRASVMSLRGSAFVEASRLMGNGAPYSILRHILPNCITPLTVLATSMFGWALLSESALSFLGLGAPPPAPTWGNMLAGARTYLAQAPLLGILPGLCISVSLLGINLLGDSLRDRLDPRMRNIAG
ncbi:ABC transporter permease [Salipiger thiooxidans]|uniref:ABC transporter permease n=1 Tax=Salipiger thiooxidans TaxID=282683 RepID=UPI001CD26E3B|nr:ABC transporter permease [Salipiger thiooxidans]MCA0851061.1 ABC transporter permease [Salipiger thiooxidans]